MDFPQEYEILVDWKGSCRDGIDIHMGSVANWISQSQVLHEMVENGPNVMTVLEDDAVPTRHLPAVLAALENMTDYFDIVFLHYGPDRPFIMARDLPAGHRMGWLRWSHYGTQGYVITRRAARTFLSHYPLARTGIDRALASYWRHGLRTFCVRPAVIHHAEHFQRESSMKLNAPVVRWPESSRALRRGWFRTKEGTLKKIAFSRRMIRTFGFAAGLRRIMWPE